PSETSVRSVNPTSTARPSIVAGDEYAARVGAYCHRTFSCLPDPPPSAMATTATRPVDPFLAETTTIPRPMAGTESTMPGTSPRQRIRSVAPGVDPGRQGRRAGPVVGPGE